MKVMVHPNRAGNYRESLLRRPDGSAAVEPSGKDNGRDRPVAVIDGKNELLGVRSLLDVDFCVGNVEVGELSLQPNAVPAP